MVGEARPSYAGGRPGRVAQWESARFTRERSLVRNQPRPSSELPAKRPFSWPPVDLDSRPVTAPNVPLGHSLGQSPALAECRWSSSVAARDPLGRPLAQRTRVAGDAPRAWPAPAPTRQLTGANSDAP